MFCWPLGTLLKFVTRVFSCLESGSVLKAADFRWAKEKSQSLVCKLASGHRESLQSQESRKHIFTANRVATEYSHLKLNEIFLSVGWYFSNKWAVTEKHHENNAKLVLTILLIDDSSIYQDDIFQSRSPHADCFKIDDILSDFVKKFTFKFV